MFERNHVFMLTSQQVQCLQSLLRNTSAPCPRIMCLNPHSKPKFVIAIAQIEIEQIYKVLQARNKCSNFPTFERLHKCLAAYTAYLVMLYSK